MKIQRSLSLLLGSVTMVAGACVPSPTTPGTTTSTPSSSTTTSTTQPVSTSTTLPPRPTTTSQMLDATNAILHQLFDGTRWEPELNAIYVEIGTIPGSTVGKAYCHSGEGHDQNYILVDPELYDPDYPMSDAPGILAHEFGHIIGCNRWGWDDSLGRILMAPPAFIDEWGVTAGKEHFADCYAMSRVPEFVAEMDGDYGCPGPDWVQAAAQAADTPPTQPLLRAG